MCLYIYTYICIHSFLDVLIHIQPYICNHFPLIEMVPLIKKPPGPNPKFSEYIFQRGQYILQFRLLKNQLLPESFELGGQFGGWNDN